MATRTLEVRISGDASSLNRALRSTTGSTSKSRAAFSALGRAAKYAGVAIAAGVGLELKRSIDQARESIKVTSQTNAVLKSTGKAAHVSAKGVEELANAISMKAGIDDEMIQSAENMLLTFRDIRNESGKGNKIFTQATKVVTDLSVAMDQPLKNSAIQVGKALNDPVTGLTSLTRVGVQFTTQQKDQIAALTESGEKLKAQKIILGELNKEFKGSAAAQADPMDKLKVAWENLEESLGKALLPILNRAAQALSKFITQFQQGRGAGGRFKETMKGVWEALKPVLVILKDLTAFLFTHKAALLAVVAAYVTFKAATLSTALALRVLAVAGVETEAALTLANPIGLTAVAIVALGVAVFVAYKKIKVFRDTVNSAFASAKNTIKRFADGARQALAGLRQFIRGFVEVVTGILTLRFGKVWKGLKDMFSGGVKALIGTLRFAYSPFIEIAKKIGSGLSDTFGGAWDRVKKVFQGGANAVIDIVAAIIGVINKIPGVNIPVPGHVGGGGGGRGGIDNTGVQHHPHHGGKHVDSGGHGRARGGAVTRPTVMVGEEAPRHPEWVIATNPAYRRSNMGYWAKAGRDLGVPGFGVGGAIKGAAGAVGGAAKGALDLALKPAKFFTDKLPSPGDYLPKWLLGTGEFMIKKAVDYIKDKAGSFLGGGGGGNLISIGHGLQGLGFSVAGHPAFPPIGTHTPGSLHYSGRAIDVNRDGGPSAESVYLRPLYDALAFSRPTELFYQNRGIPGPVPNHYDHLHLGYREGGKINVGKYNRVFSNPSKALPFNVVAAIAESVGLPGVTFAQVAQGESGLRPGVSSSDGGYGLWQMTPRVQSAATVSKWESIGSYFNPVANAKMAKILYRGAGGLGNWFGTGSVTGSNLHFGGGFTTGEGEKGGGAPPLPTTGVFAGKSPKQVRKMQAQIRGRRRRRKQAKQWKRYQHGIAQQWADLGVSVPYGGKVDFPEVEAGDDPAAEAAATLAEAIRAQAEAMAELSAQLKQQNEFATAVTTVSLREAWRAMADLISGQIAGNLQPIGGTKPAGMSGINRF